MKKQRILKKALRIICVQQGITYKDIADELGIEKRDLLYAIEIVYHDKHKLICDYAKEKITDKLNAKIYCILNDISFKDYCYKKNIKYSSFLKDCSEIK